MVSLIPSSPSWPKLALVSVTALSLSSPAVAQEDEDGITRFAPGATGEITQDLVEMMRRARDEASSLRDSLKIQDPAKRPDFDAAGARDKALQNPKILELLGVDGEKELAQAREDAGGGEAWNKTKGFLFASFSIPPTALRDLMIGAYEMGLPVLFRGFYENSVFATNDALLEVFETQEEIKGFSIDPTLFRQFDVQAVPTLVVLKDPYEMCQTQACKDDAAPPHDRIAGTITVKSALDIIKRGTGEASDVAALILEKAAQ